MFGFGNKRAAAVDEAERYIRSMFAGLGGVEAKQLANQVFADPYVAGFLQVLTVHAVAGVFHSRMPDQTTITAILAAALDRMGPGYGAVVVKGLAEIGNSAHPLHANYLSGRYDGSEHVRALLASDEIIRNERFRSFRNFVTRHYL
ncbi:MAG: hypothetical protein JWR51_490 [Devosia sp.]|uniref:hypothetical protein n=1 Tax=Devosia sp. TaxID=1871048 RepID=UPI00260A9B9A|nr:hypothetical protein [Devosia sp.]MDB5527387.1 hypothetical protein [Devosia sp.]